MNTGSEVVKGSHKSQYVTLIFRLHKTRIALRKFKGILKDNFKVFLGAPRQFLSDCKGRGILKRWYSCNFKATDLSAGQCINGALAGEWGSKLLKSEISKKHPIYRGFFLIEFKPIVLPIFRFDGEKVPEATGQKIVRIDF